MIRSPVLRAVALTIAAAFLLNIESAIVKLLGHAVPVAMIVAARAMAQIVWVAPALARHGRRPFRTDRPWLHVMRGLLSVCSWGAYYYAFQELPMATATVLSFTSIMWTTALAPLVLGEKVGWRRWSATLVGFAGVLLILRPGTLPLTLATFAALGSAIGGAGIVLTTKKLAATESTETIMLYIGLVTTAVALPVAVLDWAWLPPLHWLALLVMAGLGVTGMFFWISALRLADASLLSPVNYIRLVFATILGMALFNERPDAFTMVGAAMIVASAIYITRREATLARQARAEAREG
jgi:drug/metabolite transporter (DMT)-like permease